jgi:hypothetical protein
MYLAFGVLRRAPNGFRVRSGVLYDLPAPNERHER